MAGLSCVMRVVYPRVYQTAIPDQQTRDVLGHVFSMHNITTEATVVLELFKGVPLAVKALRKALSKRVGAVLIPVASLPEG